MSARVLGIEHLHAAKKRRAEREQQARRRFYEGPPLPVRRPTLDEIMGAWSAPRGGGDAA